MVALPDGFRGMAINDLGNRGQVHFLAPVFPGFPEMTPCG